jgi:hypothetical protein
MEKVHSPRGGETLVRCPIAPRLVDLASKTIGESWNGDFKGDRTFPLIRELLQARYPGLKFVPYTEFPYFHGADDPARQNELARAIALRARELECDALLSGNGA